MNEYSAHWWLKDSVQVKTSMYILNWVKELWSN